MLSQRTDSDFWNEYRKIPLPDTLGRVLDLYDSTGTVEPVEFAMFPEPSWYCILAGHNRLPRTYHRGADLSDFSKVRHIMTTILNKNDQVAQSLPSHRSFIEAMNKGNDSKEMQASVDPAWGRESR